MQFFTLGAILKNFKALIAAGLFVFCAVNAASAADRRVDIVNDTGKVMEEFYASAVDTDDWEEDILGKDVLADGEEVEIDIDDGSGACKFDFKAVFTDGTERVKRGVNVCSISKYTYR